MMLHEEAVKFLTENEIPLTELMKFPKDKFQEFKMIYSQNIGSPVLAHIKEHLEYYKIDPQIFNHVYLGIMGIALKQPVSSEGNLSKLDNAASRIKMHLVNEENTSLEKPLKAIARVRIPMVEEKNEDEDEDDRTSNKSDKPEGDAPEGGEEEKKSEKAEVVKVEAEIEDRVQVVNPVGEDYRIWVIHQAGPRYVRREIMTFMKKVVKQFDELDIDEVIEKVEKVANYFEDDFVKKNANDDELPCFDYELN